MTDAIVITRHAAFVEYLRERGLIDEDTLVVPDCRDPAMIHGRVVIGPCPLHLAALARCVIHFPIRLDRDDRGRELSLEELRERVGDPEEYRVDRDENPYWLRLLRSDVEFRAMAEAHGLPRDIDPSAFLDSVFTRWAEDHELVVTGLGARRPGPINATQQAMDLLADLARLPTAPFERERNAWLRVDGTPVIQIVVELSSGHTSIVRTLARRRA